MKELKVIKNNFILISPDFPPPFIGGSLVYVHNLITNSNCKFDVLTNKVNRKKNQNIHHIESKNIINSDSPSFFKLFKMYIFIAYFLLMNFRKYDLVVLNISAIGNGFFAFLLNFLNRKSMIISFAEELTLAMKSKGIKGQLKNICLKGYKKANMNISISHFAKDLLIKDLKVGTPIHVIPTPVHNEKFESVNSDVNQRSGILSVGRLIERKGHILVIKAFQKTLQKNPSLNLTIVGDGPEYKKIYKYINENALSESVKIYRNVSDEFLIDQYKKHELFILANLLLDNGDCEGAPNVLIEAASYGLPSIAGEEGGTSDVVEHNKSGILLNPKDINNLSNVIIELLADKIRLKKMSQFAISKAKNKHNKVDAGLAFKKHLEACINNLND
jgi:glycosyltransferase involved in cell wall biosynthesis